MPKKSLYEDHVQAGTRGYYAPNPALGVLVVKPAPDCSTLPARRGYKWLCHPESSPTSLLVVQIRDFIPEKFYAEYLSSR